MDKDSFTPDVRSTVFTALSGRSGDVSGRADADVSGMLLAAFGEGRRGGVDTRAAATGLGVSQRTVQRWLATQAHQHSRPSTAHLKALAGRARRAATTQRGRRAAIADARTGPVSRHGAKLSVRGQQGPTRAGTDYRRLRKIDLMLDPDQTEAMFAAYEQGGDPGFVSWLEGHAGREYVPDWGFDSLAGIDLADPGEGVES